MAAIRLIILFGIVAVVLLFGLGMFQQDDLIPTPTAGTDAGNESTRTQEGIRVEYTVFAWAAIFGIGGLIVVVLFMKWAGWI